MQLFDDRGGMAASRFITQRRVKGLVFSWGERASSGPLFRSPRNKIGLQPSFHESTLLIHTVEETLVLQLAFGGVSPPPLKTHTHAP